MDLKRTTRGRISEYVAKYPNAKYVEGKRPWLNVISHTQPRIKRRRS
jgi:hypothetical protein